MRKFMICNKAVITPGPIIIKIQIRCHTLILLEFTRPGVTHLVDQTLCLIVEKGLGMNWLFLNVVTRGILPDLQSLLP